MLYIGESEFTVSDVPGDEDNRTISFLIDRDEFNTLKEGENIYLSYGRIAVEKVLHGDLLWTKS